MGQETTVRKARDVALALTALGAEGLPCQIVMLDGQLVHPSAPVPVAWHEIRLRTPAGMVTLRRQSEDVSVIVFGNAAPDVVATRDRIAAALDAKK